MPLLWRHERVLLTTTPPVASPSEAPKIDWPHEGDRAVVERTDYALFGALAQIRYTEAVATLDADVLVGVPVPDAMKGYLPEGEAIRVGDWPLQFIPAFNPLTREAMANAESTEFEGIPFRVVRADYLAAIALAAGRPKDMARILALLESGCVTPDDVTALAARHGLLDAWQRFETRLLND